MLSKKRKGFTLIELMITVLIIGIITAWAVPNYKDYLLRAHISEALNGLSFTKLKLEQYFQDNRTYVGGCNDGSAAKPPSVKNFTLSCVLTENSYSLNAEGQDFTFTIDNTNNKSTTSSPKGWNTSETCWIINKQGACQE
jgi:type IV pilus assembly protein PilE